MTTRGGLALLLALLALGGCKGGSALLRVHVPEGYDRSRLTLVATLYQPGQASGVDCPAVIYGDFAEDDLLASRVGSATLLEAAGELGQIPSRGHKLVWVQAFDADEQLQLAGCQEFDNQRAVDVELEPSTRFNGLQFGEQTLPFALTDSLAAEVAVGGSAPMQPTLSLGAETARGAAPPAGALVRVRVIGPRGDVVGVEELALDDAGGLDYQGLVHFTGPFAVEFSTRFAGDERGRQVVRGFALPAESRVQPFGPDKVIWSVPLRQVFDGAGFAALTVSAAGVPTLRFALAERDVDATRDFVRAEAELGALWPVGTVLDSRQGEGQALLLAQPTLGLAGTRFEARLLLLWAQGRTVRSEEIRWPHATPLDAEPLLAALPAGPCDGRAVPGGDPDAPPLVLSFLGLDAGSPVSGPLRLADLDGNVSDDLASCFAPGFVQLLGSHCVADEDDVHHRVLTVRAYDAEGSWSTRAIDLEQGLRAEQIDAGVAALCSYIQARPIQELALGQVLGPALGSDGEPRLISTAVNGFSVQLEQLRASREPDAVLLREELLADGLRAPAEVLAGGAFADVGRRDLASLFTLRVEGEDDGEALLTFMHQDGDWGGGELVGAVSIGKCGQVQRLTSGLGRPACYLAVRDLDRDGRDELLFSRVTPRADGNREASHWIFHLDQWELAE